MPPAVEILRADFERIAACSRTLPDRLSPAARALVEEVELRSRVLEVGCGTGALARSLVTRRGARVTAIDLAPGMIDVARQRTPASLGIDYRVADVMALSPRGFDVAIAVDALHHVPLAEGAQRMADAVVAGGRVLIADLFLARGLDELAYNGLSWLLRSPPAADGDLSAAWRAHGAHDELMPLRAIRAALERVLPGVVVRRRLGWRYTAIWRKR